MTLWGQCDWCDAEPVALRYIPGGNRDGRPSICGRCKADAEARAAEAEPSGRHDVIPPIAPVRREDDG